MSHDETNWADALFAQPHFGGSGMSHDEHMTKTEAINYIRTEMETVLDDDYPDRMESLVDELIDMGYGEEAAYELIFDTQEWVYC